ncbi:putative phospholipase D [Helianthus debilis subsp. tardiflorus]
MSLWAEHLGLVDDRFTQPESLECVRYVRSLSEANWRQFAADEVSEMRGHLLKGLHIHTPNCLFPHPSRRLV